MDSALSTQLLPTFGHLQLEEIHEADVHRWFDEYSSTAPAGANRALDVLRQLLNFAIDCGLITSNPARLVKRNRRPERTRFLSSEEIAQLHAALDRHEGRGSGRQQAEIIRLLLATGCRKSEILKLKWAEVEGDSLRLTDSKTGPRTVLLNLQARRVLARQPNLGGEYVFPDLSNPGQCRSEELSLWRKLRRQLAIEDVRLHDLRHTFASHAVMQKIPIPVVSRLLGHSKARMTFRYAHAGDIETQNAAERVGSALAAALEGKPFNACKVKNAVDLSTGGGIAFKTESAVEKTCYPCCNTSRDTECWVGKIEEPCPVTKSLSRQPITRLLRDHLAQCSWSVSEAASQLGCSRQTLSRVLNHRMGISTAMALAFERIGWRNAAFWVCVQALNELDRRRAGQKAKSRANS